MQRTTPRHSINITLVAIFATVGLAACGSDETTGGGSTGASGGGTSGGAADGLNLSDGISFDTGTSSGATDGTASSSGATDGTASSSGTTDAASSTSSSGSADTSSSSGATDTASSSGGTDTASSGGTDAGSSSGTDTASSGGTDTASSSGTDTASSSGGGDTTSSSSGGDGVTTEGSCVGLCGKYVGGAACQCDGSCEKFGDCCKDKPTACPTEAECKTDDECKDALDCTESTCDKDKGKCVHTIAAKTCLIYDACYKEGEAGDKACLVCKPETKNGDWTANSGGTCDDSNACTDNDVCDESGVCAGAKKANCCAKDSDCNTGDACKVGVCDLTAGTCTITDKADCCSEGACCDLTDNSVKKQGTQCGTDAVTEEFKCDGSDIKSRQAFNGCNGTKTTCSDAKSYYHWSEWKVIASCKADETCAQPATGKPTCQTTKACKDPTDCDDGNACSKDACAAGKCTHEVIGGCCNLPSDCDDGNKCNIPICDQNQCKNQPKTCDGTSDCEVATCEPATGACSSTVKAEFCKIGDLCVADGKVNDDDTCLACDSKANQTTWSPAAKCACSSGVCCDIAKGQIKPKASQCDDAAQAKEYRCSDKTSKVEIREAFRGCTGGSNTCSTSKTNWAWADWKDYTVCKTGEICEVADPSKPGTCKPQGGGACTGTTCCIGGSLAPHQTKCGGGAVAKTEYKCTGTGLGAKIDKREAEKGCTGKSQTCSSAAENLVWGTWKAHKSCSATETCKAAASQYDEPTCEVTQQCKPGQSCCDDKGKYLPKASKCGAKVVASKFSCSSTQEGSDVKRSDAFGGCTGTATTCSYATGDWHWAEATVYKDCKSPEKCSVVDESKPGTCAGGGGVSCSTDDKWEAGTETSKAVSVGSFNDNTTGKVLNPPMHFKSDTDLDFLKYKINDTSTTYRPVVHVEWSAPAPMNLCAWYACDKGTGGKNCKPITCPTGFKAQQNSPVSGEKANGCCTSAAKASGTLHFAPTATSGTDHTGWVYFSGGNAAPICQQANIKLEFGEKTATACTAGTTCCTATGDYAPKATKCDSAVKASEYQCSGTGTGAKVQERKAYRGCLGTSTTCSVSSTNWSWTGWTTYKQCTSSEVCSVSSKTSPGACVKSDAAICALSDKYSSGLYYSSAYNLGSYTDTSAAKWMDPEVILNSAYDAEYFKYKIEDKLNTTNPKVHVEFEGADNVVVCGYYTCDKGAGGKNCAPVKCPAGTTPSYIGSVSGANPNGCCMTAQKGTLSFSPDASGTTDESGWAYLRFANTGKVCQKVKAKLVFGSQQQTQCNPSTTCCTAAGTYATKTTKCGTSALASEYKCSSSAKGGDVLKRQAFGGCTGSSTTCSTATTNRYWDAWKTDINCTTTQVCSVPDPNKPGSCKTAADPLCSKTDTYEKGVGFSNAVSLGSFKDTSTVKIMSPKVHFGTSSDYDYFKYDIEDVFNLTDPRVSVKWTGQDLVTVCAYYQCKKGTNGKDCAPVKCPAGSTDSIYSWVSANKPNGCCMTGTTGTLSFLPDAPGTTDETGTAYVRFYNASSICQEVGVELQFGSNSNTQCDPKDVCCQADGSYAPKTTKCGTSKLSSQYKCSTTANGGDVQRRDAYAGCSGYSATLCSTSSSNLSWTSYTTDKNCSTSQICSVPDSSKPGICKDTGNTAALCKKSDTYESGSTTSTAKNIGTFKDSADAKVLSPDIHFGSTGDYDYIKYAIDDATNLSQPRVNVEFTAGESLEVCAWYSCNAGSGGKNCAPVTCDKGSKSYNYIVSGTLYNGCCASGKSGAVDFKPDTPGSSNEDGWAYVRFRNTSKVCQWVNTKLTFGGGTKACGDGKLESGESTCKQDTGTCVGKCGQFVSKDVCRCDAACETIGDCCWDYNLYCAN